MGMATAPAPPLLLTLMDLEPADLLPEEPQHRAAIQLMLRVEQLFPAGAAAADVLRGAGADINKAEFSHLKLFLGRLQSNAPWARFTAPMAGSVSGWAVATGNPANVVLAAHSVAAASARAPGGVATVQQFMVDALQYRLPTPATWERLWRAQKCAPTSETDNWLDQQAAWSREVLCAAAA